MNYPKHNCFGGFSFSMVISLKVNQRNSVSKLTVHVISLVPAVASHTPALRDQMGCTPVVMEIHSHAPVMTRMTRVTRPRQLVYLQNSK